MSQIKLGMPHLNYNGLDQVWLLKHLGNSHWDMLGSQLALSDVNERLYASFFCVMIDFNKGQHHFAESNLLKIDSEIFKFNKQIYRSVHSLSNKTNRATAILDSVFVKKDNSTNLLVRQDPVSLVRQISNVDKVFLEDHKAMKNKLKDTNFSDLKEIEFCHETYFNAVKILYFANYANLISLSEQKFYSGPRGPITKLKIYFFSNIQLGDKVYGITSRNGNQYETTLVANNKAIAHGIIERENAN